MGTWQRLQGAMVLVIVAALCGCRSIESRLIDADPRTGRLAEAKLQGYPITLKVPTHLRITLYRNHFIEESRDGGVQVVTYANEPLTTISYASQLLETEKVFTVDHLRPAAGQLHYGINFTADQYIDKVSSAATEDAIRQSSLAMARAATLLRSGSVNPRSQADRTRVLSAGAFKSIASEAVSQQPGVEPSALRIGTRSLPLNSKGDGRNVDEHHAVGQSNTAIESVIATCIFAVDSPTFELDISEFLVQSLPAGR